MIRLSRLTDYAVTLLTQMVSEGKGYWAASDLGTKSGVPLPTVSKILKQLAKTGIVSAQRGAAGGYKLVRPGEKISIAAIIEAMDGPIALTDCAEGSAHACRVEPICPMSGNWNKVNRAVRDALETVSLADMVGSSRAPDFKHALEREKVDS
ncbi:MAG: SUF system Fe-S cluster assembly regulator [Pseudomonadota bacterium]|nr:SUF system Fe-S cluster assembly regulator [Pseudomonadota bacterium]